MNGHADHNRLQPCRLESDLFTNGTITSPASLLVGAPPCSAWAATLPSSVERRRRWPAAVDTDWPQTFAGKGAAAYVGNLGYGYGDSITVAYGEALNVRLASGAARRLTIGDALVPGQAGLFRLSRHRRRLRREGDVRGSPSTGLPMWTLRGAPPAVERTPPASRRRHAALDRSRSDHRPGWSTTTARSRRLTAS